MSDLGQRAVACKGFRWMKRMALIDRGGKRWTVTAVQLTTGRPMVLATEDAPDGHEHERTPGWVSTFGSRPDLDDQATLGCLLAIVREAWGSEFVFVHPPNRLDPWDVLCPDDGAWSRIGRGDTEAEALVAALEAAP